MTETLLIIDFGGQLTQLIARRVREAGVYSEIVPFSRAAEAVAALKPKAIILSGGPASVTESDSPRAPSAVFEAGVPVLGICYGQQTMVAQLGGQVESSHTREYGAANIKIIEDNRLFDNIGGPGTVEPVWMSHGDRVIALPPASVHSPSPNMRLLPPLPMMIAAFMASSSIPKPLTRRMGR